MPLLRLTAMVAAGLLSAPAAVASGPEPAAVLATALPAVVRIDVVKRVQPVAGRGEFQQQLDRLLERAERAAADPREESGSGFVVDSAAGLVAAAEFVVSNAESITLLLHDGRTVAAELVASDEESQLALLRAAVAGLPTLEWGDSEKLRRGDPVYAAGHQFNLGLLVTGGIHSGVIGPSDRTSGREYLATDAPVMLGNAGGPLLDAAGRVVGVVIGNFGTSMDRSLGIAVPASIARPVLERLREGAASPAGADVEGQ